jgi:TonB family protein
VGEEEAVSVQVWRRVLLFSLLSFAIVDAGLTTIARAQQEEGTRKVQTKVAPVYPDLARRMKIVGVVKVQVIVAPNGNVKDVNIVGGHPLLANAVVDAVRKWHYETASKETTETREFRFDPNQ